MNEPRKREAGRGMLAGLFGAGLLMLVGFGLGLVVGAAWQDSDLLVSELQGETELVPLADVAAAPDEMASAPLGRALEPERAAEPAANPTPAPRLREPAKPREQAKRAPAPAAVPATRAMSSNEGFEIQVGAFTDRAAADRLAARLRDGGYPVHVRTNPEGGNHRYRVRVGPWAERDQADAVATRLKHEERLPTWVVSRDG